MPIQICGGGSPCKEPKTAKKDADKDKNPVKDADMIYVTEPSGCGEGDDPFNEATPLAGAP